MRHLERPLLTLVLLSACGPAVGLDSDAGTAGSSSGGPGDPATTAPPPASTTTSPPVTSAATTEPPPGTVTGTTDTFETDTFETDGSSDTGYEFIIPPDGGVCGVGLPPGTLAHCSYECDLWEQDCLRGDKCVPWSNDGGNRWNATICRPVDPTPDPVGSPCLVEGSGVSGIDTCGADAMCWNVDPETLEGICVARCSGEPAAPLCADPSMTCVQANDGVLNLCLPTCDPLASTCLPGEGCYPSGNSEGQGPFACLRALDPVEVDSLEHPLCAPGSFLATSEQNPSCGDAPCCTTFCELDAPQCPGTETCQPYFAEGESPAPSDVGFCRPQE